MKKKKNNDDIVTRNCGFEFISNDELDEFNEIISEIDAEDMEEEKKTGIKVELSVPIRLARYAEKLMARHPEILDDLKNKN